MVIVGSEKLESKSGWWCTITNAVSNRINAVIKPCRDLSKLSKKESQERFTGALQRLSSSQSIRLPQSSSSSALAGRHRQVGMP
jgi:hypothetical protein